MKSKRRGMRVMKQRRVGRVVLPLIAAMSLWFPGIPQLLGQQPVNIVVTVGSFALPFFVPVGEGECTAILANDSPWITNASIIVGVPSILSFNVAENPGPFVRKGVITLNCGQVLVLQCVNGNDCTKLPPSCQVNVTRLGQCRLGDGREAPWKNDPYPSLPLPSDFTVCKKGCAMTSLSMALNFAGVPELPLFALENTPRNLNKFMSLVDSDYIATGTVPLLNRSAKVNWGPATRDTSTFRFKFDTLGGAKSSITNNGTDNLFTSQTAARDALDKALCEGHPVIVGVKLRFNSGGIPQPGHFVLATGKRGSEYLIADPNDPTNQNKTLDAFTSFTNTVGLFEAGEPVFETRGVVKDPPGDISELDLAVGSTGDILVIDANGRRTGFDGATRTRVQDIPGSAHFRDALDDDETGEPDFESAKFVQIFQPSQGVYRIILIGLKVGIYALSVDSFSADGSSKPELSVSGVTASGSASSFQIEFSSTPGAATTVLRVATLQSTLDDIGNSLQLDLIDNHGIANSLSRKIQAAANATSSARTNILNAFKNEVNVQSGKHITALVAQVLLEDADSLISQNQ
jgi:hypothetical protein